MRMVFQSYAPFPYLDVVENVASGVFGGGRLQGKGNRSCGWRGRARAMGVG